MSRPTLCKTHDCWFASALFVLLLSSCGSNSGASGGGQVTDTWRDYCVATFTKDVPFKAFDEIVFTAHAGEQYLLTNYDSLRVEIAYLTTAGPDSFTVPVTSGSSAYPFTSSCKVGEATRYYGVFTDVRVFDSEALTHEICSFSAGTAVKLDEHALAGYEASSMGFSGPAIYSIILNALGSQCGGATHGYISVPETEVFGATTWLVPIATILKN